MFLKLFELDIKSIISLLFWGNFSLFALFFSYQFTQEKNETKTQIFEYCMSKFIQAFSWLLIFYRAVLPDWISVSLANTGLFVSFFLESIVMLAMIKCCQHRNRLIQISILVISILGFNIVEIFNNHPNTRVTVASLAVFLILLQPTVKYIITPGESAFQRILGFNYAVFLILMLLRSIFGLNYESANIFSNNLIQAMTFVTVFLLMITGGIGFLLLVKEEKNIKIRKLVEDKDRFFSIISHDLRGPIGSISMVLNQLSSVDNLPADYRQKMLAELSKLSEKTFILLENLLEWSSLQLNTLRVNFEKVKLAELIEECINLLRDIAAQKNINIVIAIDRNFEITVDKKMFSTVIRNIVSNSIKFVNPGGKILINASEFGGHTEVIIKDNGIGINKKDIEKLLLIGEKVSNKGTTGELGSGIGLKLCKELIEKNNGKINIKSEVNAGTEVILEFMR